VIDDAFGILEMSKWTKNDKSAYEKTVIEEGEARQKMNYAREEGRQEGRQVGRQEGIQEGIQAGIKESIRNTYQELTQDVDALARTFNKDPNEIKEILGKLDRQ
jgi:predicted transposase YdaD